MSIARKWVFPILRILVFAVIAAALVKLAFFADPVEQERRVPTGEIVEPQIAGDDRHDPERRRADRHGQRRCRRRR